MDERRLRARVQWKRHTPPQGQAPSPRRVAAWQRLRGWEAAEDLRLRQWMRGLHLRNLLAQQAARVARGDAPYYPHPLPQLLTELRSRIDLALLGWVVFAARLQQGAALVGPFEALAKLLGCTSRYTQIAVDRLERAGLLQVNYHYVREPNADGKVVAWSLSNSFVMGPRLRAILSQRDRAAAAARAAARRDPSQAPIAPRGAGGRRSAACADAAGAGDRVDPPSSQPSAGSASRDHGASCVASSVRPPAAAGSMAPAAPPFNDRVESPRKLVPPEDPDHLRSLSDRSRDRSSIGSAGSPADRTRGSTVRRPPRGGPLYPGRSVVRREALEKVVSQTDGDPFEPFDDRGRAFLALLREQLEVDDG